MQMSKCANVQMGAIHLHIFVFAHLRILKSAYKVRQSWQLLIFI